MSEKHMMFNTFYHGIACLEHDLHYSVYCKYCIDEHIKKLESIISKMREVNSFYADKGNYDWYYDKNAEVTDEVFEDNGERARKLEKYLKENYDK